MTTSVTRFELNSYDGSSKDILLLPQGTDSISIGNQKFLVSNNDYLKLYQYFDGRNIELDPYAIEISRFHLFDKAVALDEKIFILGKSSYTSDSELAIVNLGSMKVEYVSGLEEFIIFDMTAGKESVFLSVYSKIKNERGVLIIDSNSELSNFTPLNTSFSDSSQIMPIIPLN
jgi:hypothetical protein